MDAITDAVENRQEDAADFVDLPEADIEFLRTAATKLEGAWAVATHTAVLSDEHTQAVTYAEIMPAPSNASALLSYDVHKLSDGSYNVWAFTHPYPDRDTAENAADLCISATVEDAMDAVTLAELLMSCRHGTLAIHEDSLESA